MVNKNYFPFDVKYSVIARLVACNEVPEGSEVYSSDWSVE
jgi:hypothetical protein